MKKSVKKPESNLLPRVMIFALMSILLIGLCLFLPAGTLKYWNGWLFCAAFFIPMSICGVYLFIKHPGLLEKRMQLKEKVPTQNRIMTLALPIYIIAFIIPGFDFRYHWSNIPAWLVVVSTLAMLAGYALLIRVFLQNSYASRIIEVQKKQKVIDKGPYAVIRHPMYAAVIIMYLFSPLILGSYYALIPMAGVVVIVVLRILNEEAVLKKGLKGYSNYMKKVKYRLIPRIW